MNYPVSWPELKEILGKERVKNILPLNKTEVQVLMESGREFILMCTFQNRIACVEVTKENKNGQ